MGREETGYKGEKAKAIIYYSGETMPLKKVLIIPKTSRLNISHALPIFFQLIQNKLCLYQLF